MKTKEEVKKEFDELVAQRQQVENQMNKITTQIIELQGVMKFLEEAPDA